MVAVRSLVTGTAAALLPLGVRAAEPVKLAASPGVAVSFGSALQVALGLAVVLTMVAGAAWLIKRLGVVPGGGTGIVRVVGGAAVGQRERVVLVEINGTWIVVGVAPGHVTSLLTMAKPADAPADASPPASAAFASWLKQTLEKRGHG